MRKRAVYIQATFGFIRQFTTIVRGLLLVPLYINFIGVNLYGLWLASGGVLIWMAMLELGVGTGIGQRMAYNYAKGNNQKLCNYFFNGLVIYIFIGVLFFAVGYIVSLPLPYIINAEETEIEIIRKCFRIAVLSHFFYLLNHVLRGFSLSLLRPLFPSVTLVIWQMVGIVITIYMLFNNVGLLSIPLGHLISQVGIFIFNGVYAAMNIIKMKTHIIFDKEVFVDIRRLIPSLFGANIGTSLVQNIEPTLIAAIINPGLAAGFALTKRAADLVSQSMNVIIGSLQSSFTNLVAEGNKEEINFILEKIFNITIFGSLIGFSTYIINNKPFIQLWVGNELYLGNVMTVLIAVGIISRIFFRFLYEILICFGHIKFSSFAVLNEAFFRFVAMVILIYLFGAQGAPIGMLLTGVIFAGILLNHLNNRINIKELIKPYTQYIFSIIMFLSFTLLLLLFQPDATSWIMFAFNLLLTILCLFSISIFNKSFRNFVFETLVRV